jgi:LysM repeat protein
MKARRLTFTLSVCSFAVVLSGCETFDTMASGGASSQAQAQTQYSYLEERIRNLDQRLEGLAQNYSTLQRDLADVQARLNNLQSGSVGQASASELQALRTQVQNLEVQREKDKQIILDQLAKEIAGLASSRSARSPSGSSGGNEVGYEYTVKQGDTLAAIAKTYGTTVTAIKKANNLSSDVLRIGQRLFIPKS